MADSVVPIGFDPDILVDNPVLNTGTTNGILLTVKRTLSNFFAEQDGSSKLQDITICEKNTTAKKNSIRIILFNNSDVLTATAGTAFAFDTNTTKANILAVIDFAEANYKDLTTGTDKYSYMSAKENGMTPIDLISLDLTDFNIYYCIVLNDAAATAYVGGADEMCVKFYSNRN